MIPEGSLVRSRVVDDPGEPLAAALATELTGYVVLEPGDALLLDGGTRAVVTFADGVPVLAYERDGDRAGTAALDAVDPTGPTRAERYELPASALRAAHESEADEFRVPPGAPAERLARDPDLAERTRDAAPADRLAEATGAVESFLDDEERIAEIQREAREEARRRADEWGLRGELAGDGAVRESDDSAGEGHGSAGEDHGPPGEDHGPSVAEASGDESDAPSVADPPDPDGAGG